MDALTTIHPQAPGFLTGVIFVLVILGVVWIILDRKDLKARVAAYEAKAAPTVKAIEHEIHVAEAAVKVPSEDIRTALNAFFADIRAEAARLEAAKAAAAATPAAPPAPTAAPQA